MIFGESANNHQALGIGGFGYGTSTCREDRHCDCCCPGDRAGDGAGVVVRRQGGHRAEALDGRAQHGEAGSGDAVVVGEEDLQGHPVILADARGARRASSTGRAAGGRGHVCEGRAGSNVILAPGGRLVYPVTDTRACVRGRRSRGPVV